MKNPMRNPCVALVLLSTLNMKTKLKLIAALALLSALNQQLSTVSAQGTAFTYQGRLNDGADLAGGSFDLKFSLFNVSSGGSAMAAAAVNAIASRAPR